MTAERRARSSRHGWMAALLLAIVMAGALLAGCGGGSHSGSGPSPPAASADASVIVPAQEAGKPIPRAFFGLSTEYLTLAKIEPYAQLYERVLKQLQVPGDGRFVLRIGGDTADHAVFDRSADQLPPWALKITPKGVADVVRLIQDLNLRVIMDLNTVSTTPRVMAGWVSEILRDAALPTGSLVNLEIGNEPDIYNRQTWEFNIKAGNRPSSLTKAAVAPHNAPDRITPESYYRRYLEFARELAAVVPNVPLAAPALAESENVHWLSTLLRNPHRLGLITFHIYPYSKCAKPGEPKYPTVEKLLSENATAGLRRTIAPAVALAHKAGFSVRLTEINSVTCGGLAGVSDTFATALWAPDALFELLRSGIEGVNLHARIESVNDPFDFDKQGHLHTHPLIYGLIFFTRMLGAHAELVPAQLQSSPSLHLKVWAVRSGAATNKLNTLKLLLINKGPRSALINLHLPTSSAATVVRLLAPSASSEEAEVTLGGQRLDQQAQWSGKPQVETIKPSGGRYLVQVKGESAAMLTVPIAATTLVTRKGATAGPKPEFGYE